MININKIVIILIFIFNSSCSINNYDVVSQCTRLDEKRDLLKYKAQNNYQDKGFEWKNMLIIPAIIKTYKINFLDPKQKINKIEALMSRKGCIQKKPYLNSNITSPNLQKHRGQENYKNNIAKYNLTSIKLPKNQPEDSYYNQYDDYVKYLYHKKKAERLDKNIKNYDIQYFDRRKPIDDEILLYNRR